MTDPLDQFRRAAKSLKKAYEAGATAALGRVRAVDPRPHGGPLKHADFLHVIARENSFASWPAMKAAIQDLGVDRAQLRQRLLIAIHNRQGDLAQDLLKDAPDLAAGHFGLSCALYDVPAVEAMLASDPKHAQGDGTPWSPLVTLCKSPMFQVWPDRSRAMFEIAQLLMSHGADVNRAAEAAPDLSPLYWALGHAGNLPLAKWLLDHGADPDDGESLYHATELGHTNGVAILLAHGATVSGTNALPRAMDFDNAHMVDMLLQGGADPNEGSDAWVQGTGLQSGVPVLHQAARRMNSGPVLDALLAHGADPTATWQGHSAYAFACVFGNQQLVDRIEARGQQTALTPIEEALAGAARGTPSGFVDPAQIPEAYRNILREIVHLPGKLPHIKALVSMGLEWDRPDAEGLTPVQVAGWSGRPDVMGYLLSLKPDLGHVNGYGGTLFSTILHGSDNNPDRASGDYVACMTLALESGVALPRKALTFAGDKRLRALLADWADQHPGQVVDHGPV